MENLYHVCDFLLLNNSNIHPISYHLQDIVDYWSFFVVVKGLPLLTHMFGAKCSLRKLETLLCGVVPALQQALIT